MSTHNKPDCNACAEYNELSRREFLARTTMAAAVLAAPAWLPQVAYAQTEDTSRDVIVSIFLRGGADGLSMVPPYAENAYYTLRPTIAIPRPDSSSVNKALDLNGFFGLPPAMGSLLPAYQAGHLLIVHAAGLDRSDAVALRRAGVHGGRRAGRARHRNGLARPAPREQAADEAGAALRALAFNYGLPLMLAGAPTRCRFPIRRTSRCRAPRRPRRSGWRGSGRRSRESSTRSRPPRSTRSARSPSWPPSTSTAMHRPAAPSIRPRASARRCARRRRSSARTSASRRSRSTSAAGTRTTRRARSPEGWRRRCARSPTRSRPSTPTWSAPAASAASRWS